MEFRRVVRGAWKYIRHKNAAGRNVLVFPDDVWLVSYPRSGNTWSSFLISNLLDEAEPTTFANLNEKVPDIYKSSQATLLRTPRPRILKSHEPFDPRYRRVIYLIRDPRDVVLSFYHFHIKFNIINETYSVQEYIQRLINGGFSAPLGSWAQNVSSWLFARQNTPGFLLLRYEDLLEDPLREMRKLAAALGIEASDARLQRAIDLSSADRMRQLEKQEGTVWRGTKKSRQDKPFVRAAKKGGWREELPPGSVEQVEAAWWPIMVKTGYTPITTITPSPATSATAAWLEIIGKTAESATVP